MSIKKRACALALLVLSTSTMAQETSVNAQETSVINEVPSSLVGQPTDLNDFKSMLSSLEPGELLDRLVAYTKQNGQWLTINLKGKPSNLHIATYLLEIGYEREAIALLGMNAIDGWVGFEFGGEYFTDIQYALAGGNSKYLQALYIKYPEKMNSQFQVGINGETSTVLGLLATKAYAILPEYESMIHLALNAGADLSTPAVGDILPEVVASTVNNIKFIKIVRGRTIGDPKLSKDGKKRIYSNPMLSQVELLEEQSLIDAFIEVGLEDRDSFVLSKLHANWVDMIMRGYNNMAEVFYDELVKNDSFNINMKTAKGITALQATALSNVYGGNVSYAQRLIGRGADTKVLITLGSGDREVTANLIELSLPGDGYQTVALFIESGVPFVYNVKDKDMLIIQEAVRHRAYKSAHIIKGAIDTLISQNASK
jgi:hypothetical protein